VKEIRRKNICTYGTKGKQTGEELFSLDST